MKIKWNEKKKVLKFKVETDREVACLLDFFGGLSTSKFEEIANYSSNFTYDEQDDFTLKAYSALMGDGNAK